MKKLLTATAIVLVSMTACNENSKKETTVTETKEPTEAQRREKEISDSTKMLDKKLADPKSNYSPDSLK